MCYSMTTKTRSFALLVLKVYPKSWATALFSLVVAMAGLTPAAQAVVPIPGVTPPLTPVAINVGPVDQYDPHVSGDWAAYTSDNSIRYYRFSTAVDAQIPTGNSARDLLSDISGSKIVFSRVVASVKTAVMVFDTLTPSAAPVEIDPALGSNRIGSAIGGNTVAYIDFGLHGNGEVVVHDLTTSLSVRLTNDSVFDQNPSVSPDGAVVTWEHCATSTSNCDIWQAVKSGAVWIVGVAAGSVHPEANPDTNGTLVVYDSVRLPDHGDVFWRPVGGGAEVQLVLSSIEANPSIAGNFIAFESRPTLFATSDIFVYDITANRLYQITDTPLVTEQLNDITVLSDGKIRMVWGSDEDGFDARNVRAATFLLPGALYSVCLLYDPTKAAKSGSAVPIKLQLCDSSGNNLSSPSITVHAVSITQTSTSSSGPVEDSGNANPDNDFRFDSTLGTTGGYIFNLSTKGLPTGTYNLNFTVAGDSAVYAVPFQVK
ncbi:MAG: PxKF domain-containing protein [Acidobacteriota bacterium]